VNGERAGRRLSVLHCRCSSLRYGPEQALDQIAPALCALGIEPRVLALYRKPPGGPAIHPWVTATRDEGRWAEQVVDPGPLSLRVVRQVAGHVGRSACDVLHTHDYKSNMLGGIAARRAQSAMAWVATVHLHTDATSRLQLYRAVDLFLLRLADRVVTVSREQRRLLLRRGIERQRLVLVPNVIDAEALAPQAARGPAVRPRLGVPDAAPMIGVFGRLARQKGIDVLLEAAGRVRALRPDCHFLVVGGGPLRAELEARAARLGLGSSVRFLGYRTDVATLMAACDVIALPSRAEGLPLALLEALALGRPVVAARVGGVPDVVRHERHGLLIQPGSATALAAAVLRLLDDPQLAARLAAAGRERVRRRHAPELAARRLASVYRAVVAERA